MGAEGSFEGTLKKQKNTKRHPKVGMVSLGGFSCFVFGESCGLSQVSGFLVPWRNCVEPATIARSFKKN